MANIVINKTAFLDAPITVDSLHGMTFTNESGAHQFVISAMQGGNPLALTGSVSARFMRANNTTILLTGSVTNGKAVITLHQDCYNVPGRFQLAIFNTVSGSTTCIYAAIGTVQRTVAGDLIDSGEAVPDISELLAQIEACEQATVAANAVADDVMGTLDYNGLAMPVVDGWITGKRMSTPSVGGTFTDSPGTIASWRYVKLPCQPGDIFSVTATGTSAFLPWAFASSSLECLSRASGATVTDEDIVAPANAAWLYINQNADRGECFSGVSIQARIDELAGTVAQKANQSSVDALATDIEKRIFAKPTSQYVSNSQVTLSSITEDGFYLFGSGTTATDGPMENNVAVSYSLLGLLVENFSPSRWGTGAFVKQTVFEMSSGERKEYSRTSKVNGTYYPWVKQAVVTNNIANVTQNNTYPQYSNTYTITTSPNITTDSHNWLQSVDTDTASETDKTDMTGAILSMLNDTGYCHLSPGIFYVSGGIDMPDGSCIEGCGENTIIRLLGTVASGYILKPTRHCSIKNLRLSGSRTSINSGFTDAIGTRNGIQFVANYDGAEGTSTSQTQHCMVDNVWIEHFSGAGINCRNTSISVNRGIYVNQAYIADCHTGININHYSEFNKFLNVCTSSCYYAVMNNGGNNVFSSCTFGALNAGFVIDNSAGDQPNNAHGLCANSTFCHIGNNSGKAIWIRGTDSGYVFSCCQVHYCSINVENSSGIMFQGIQFGRGTGSSSSATPGGTIAISGGALVAFVGCAFKGAPDITVANNNAVKFDSCYDFETGNAISA